MSTTQSSTTSSDAVNEDEVQSKDDAQRTDGDVGSTEPAAPGELAAEASAGTPAPLTPTPGDFKIKLGTLPGAAKPAPIGASDRIIIEPLNRADTGYKLGLADIAQIEENAAARRARRGARVKSTTKSAGTAQSTTESAPAESSTREAPRSEAAQSKAPAPAGGAGAPAAAASAPASTPPVRSKGSAPQAGQPARTHSLSANLRERAKKVRSAVLAAEHREVSVLQMSVVTRLVEEAVAEAVQMHEIAFSEKEKARLREEAEEIFNERLKSFKAEKEDVEARAKHFKEQLDRARQLLDEEREKVVSADQFTVSNAGLVELEQRLTRILDRVIAKRGVTEELATDMRAVVAKLLDDEREKISQKAKDAQSETISLLERKVSRLAHSLEDTQKAKDEAEQRAQLLEASAGGFALKNIMEAGLKDGDPQKKKKLSLLKEIVDGNKEVRKFMSGRKGPDDDAASTSQASEPAPEPAVSAVGS